MHKQGLERFSDGVFAIILKSGSHGRGDPSRKIALALASALVALAMPPNAQGASAQSSALEQHAMALGGCGGQQAEAEIGSEKSAEQVVDDAMAACAAQEEQLKAEARRLGPEAVALVDRELKGRRSSLLAYVQDRRAGRNFTNPVTAWGQCVGSFAGDHAHDDSAPEVIAEAALASCAGLEKAAFASHPEMSANHRADARAQALKFAVDLISNARNGRQ